MAGAAAERGNRPPTEGPMPKDWDATVAQVDKVIGLAQTHLLDRFPGMTMATLEDPQDGRVWTIDLTRTDENGKLRFLRFNTPADSDHSEMFQLAAVRLGEVVDPTVSAGHIDMTRRADSERKPAIEAAREAEERLRSILRLGTDEEEAAKAEAAEKNLRRAFVEVYAHAGLTFQESNTYADIAYGIHRNQMVERAENEAERTRLAANPPEPEEEPEVTPEQRERARQIWDMLDKSIPNFRRNLTRAQRGMEEGKYYSFDVVRADVPRLPLKRRPTAGRRLSSE